MFVEYLSMGRYKDSSTEKTNGQMMHKVSEYNHVHINFLSTFKVICSKRKNVRRVIIKRGRETPKLPQVGKKNKKKKKKKIALPPPIVYSKLPHSLSLAPGDPVCFSQQWTELVTFQLSPPNKNRNKNQNVVL